MRVVIDIETVPAEDKQPFIDAAAENFKAPSNLTKGQAAADLGMADAEVKFISKDDLIAKWEKQMAAEKAPEVADDAWRKTSFDGGKGRIISIAWWLEGKETKVICSNPVNEEKTLKDFFDLLQKDLGGRPPTFIGHRVVFDLKFIYRRCVVLGIKPPFALPFRGRHGKDYFCTMEEWCEFKETISMDNLAKTLGMEGKGDFDGSMVCDAWLAGEYQKIAEYNDDDVKKTAEIYDRLNFSGVFYPGIGSRL